jgi:hypothetical protein
MKMFSISSGSGKSTVQSVLEHLGGYNGAIPGSSME